MKKLRIIAGLVIAAIALLAVTACETPVAEPTGALTPAPGQPGSGSQSGRFDTTAGTPDASYAGTRFDINNLPTPAAWNALGHQHAFPDPFRFASGNKVANAADWELRRKEISRIIQYYEYGIMPPISKEAGVDITFVNTGVSNCAITVSYQGRQYQFTIETTLPANPVESNKYNPATKTGGYPLYFGGSSVNWDGGYGGWTFSGGFANEGDGSGNVPTLFGIDHTTPDAPSANVSYAWGMSVILSVIEGIDLNGDGAIDPDTELGFRGWYNPAQVGITGYSRNGKAAEAIGAFAESRNGNRVGHTGIGSAGSGGPALERIISLTGYKTGGAYADPLPIGSAGLMQFQGLEGKPYYPAYINNGDAIPGITAAWAATPGGTSDGARIKLVRAWAPYFEDFVVSPARTSPFAADSTEKTPFVGWLRGGSGSWSGIQSLSEGRNETPGWFSVRFREFQDLHYGLDIDHVQGQEGRGKYGVLCTIPFDQHYLSALIPPNGVLFQDGYTQTRNNEESQFANWLIIDEIYKMYGEAENDVNKYIWRNGFMMTWGHHGENTGNEAADRNYHAMKIFKGEADTTHAQNDQMLAKTRFAWFPVNDPIGRFDYYRMTWGRPGHPTIAARVQAMVDPIMTDFNAWVYDTSKNPAPAAGNTPAQYAKPGGYTATGNLKKAMDWRGLLDTPEALQP